MRLEPPDGLTQRRLCNPELCGCPREAALLRDGDEGARAFYRELGEIPGYYQGVEAAIRMVRDVRAVREAAPGSTSAG